MTQIIPVIMCRDSDFLNQSSLYAKGKSPFQKTVLRVLAMTGAAGYAILTMIPESMREEATRQLESISSSLTRHILSEPVSRNTAASVAYAIHYVQNFFGENALVWLVPADSYAFGGFALAQSVHRAKSIALNGHFVRFGNTGMHLFMAKRGAEHYRHHAPEIFTAIEYALIDSWSDQNPSIRYYNQAASQPFETAVLSKATDAVVIPCEFDSQARAYLGVLPDHDHNMPAHTLFSGKMNNNGFISAPETNRGRAPSYNLSRITIRPRQMYDIDVPVGFSAHIIVTAGDALLVRDGAGMRLKEHQEMFIPPLSSCFIANPGKDDLKIFEFLIRDWPDREPASTSQFYPGWDRCGFYAETYVSGNYQCEKMGAGR